MWICQNRGFVSVVADRYNSGRLLVRARIKGHIEAVFPMAEVFTDASADYLFRAFVNREDVARQLSEEISGINYDDFKSTVADDALHDAYFGFWKTMRNLQHTQGEVTTR